MIKNFLIINFIGKNDQIGLRVNDNFFIHNFDTKIKNNDQLVLSILNLAKKHKVNFNNNFSILVNSGPGSFSSTRVSLAVAKGIKLSKKINLFGFRDYDLGQFNLANIELLIKKDLVQKNLIKPLYLS
jgi:tRNA A37 threonylcarbamoyladenosine modification protein TsaB|tara:strand:- start:414 stop:797 length:384 start_codon:yes stop_codon:yes gene_type:complete